jgi:putative heme-binding domain-containing protein
MVFLGMAASTAPTAWAQRDLKELPDPDPAKQLAGFTVEPGLRVNLFASEPLVANPIHMNFDAAGRLWVVTSPIYPQVLPGQEATDKVVVLEDTDGDGVADRQVVFAEDLLIPTGVLPGDPSKPGRLAAYVANSTELLHLEDTDGDGRADRRRVVLSGFGTEDTHHILHSFRWGPDGLMYMHQSIYIHSHVETPWGVRRLYAGGIWRFRPDNLKLDVFARGFVNSWGLAFDDWGQSFATDGAYGEGINYVFPDAAFVAAQNVKRTLRGLNPGEPKHCSLERIDGSHVPEAWRGSLITHDFRGNRVNRFAISELNSGYVSRKQPDPLASPNRAFRPVDVKMGPDGAIYIADWYDPIIQHGEVDFRDPRRDKRHGRIWRLSFADRPLVARVNLETAPLQVLVDSLRSPEPWQRLHAKLQMRERFAGEAPAALNGAWERLDARSPGFERDRLELLWAFQTLDQPQAALLRAVLSSAEPRARAAAVRVLSQWSDRAPQAYADLAKLVLDEHPRVRLEAVNALRRLGGGTSVAAAMRALEKPVDGSLDYALAITAWELRSQWLPDYLDDKLAFASPAQALFALQASEEPAALRPLLRALGEGRLPAEHRGAVLDLLGKLGSTTELRQGWDMARAPGVDPALRQGVVQALTAASERGVTPAAELEALLPWLREEPSGLRAAAMPLAGAWRLAAAEPLLREAASDPLRPMGDRAAAIDGLRRMRSVGAHEALADLAMKAQPGSIRSTALAALASAEVRRAAAVAVDALARPAEGFEAAVVFDGFLGQKQGPEVLTQALKGRSIDARAATVGVQKALSSGRKPQALVEALTRAGGLEPMRQSLSPTELAELVKAVGDRGDPGRGQEVYHRAALACTTCHAIAGGGGLVGPDMVSLGASAQTDYIIESLLEPSKKIKEGYHLTVVSLANFDVVSGSVVRETPTHLVLRDPTGRERPIALSDIVERKVEPVSMMPQGLTATLRRDEFIDLTAFLTQLGREGPFKAPNARLARRWQVLTAGGDVEGRLRSQGSGFVFKDDPALAWAPAYSRVDGTLPMSALPSLSQFGGNRLGFARFELAVVEPGRLRVALGDARGLQLWHEGRALPTGEGVELELTRGVHRLVAQVDLAERAAPLRFELVDVPGSGAKADWVGGP